MSKNKISDINVLEKVNFKDLKILYLDNNVISNIKVLEEANFKKLENLNLKDNPIDKNENTKILEILKSKINKFAI